MKRESKAVLNVRGLPRVLVAKAKAKAALQEETLREFIEGVLLDATKDMPEPKPKQHR
jgi:hypothetical protein